MMTLKNTFALHIVSLALAFWQPAAMAQDNSEAETGDGAVSLSVEELKKQVIRLNRDLFILEEDLLYPASTSLRCFSASTPANSSNWTRLNSRSMTKPLPRTCIPSARPKHCSEAVCSACTLVTSRRASTR